MALSPDTTVRPDLTNRACFAAAGAVTLAWFLAYNHFRPDYLVDEPGHLGNIYHFLEGKAGWPEAMPMLPGYHFIVAGLWQLHLPVKLLTLARGVSAICTLVGLAAFALAWRRWHGTPAGPATLLLALLPLLQPFTGMAYTDVPALAFILVAWAAHLAGHRAIAAVVLVGAACIRQTSLVWVAFIMGWEILRTCAPDQSDARPCWTRLWPRIGWMVLVAISAAVVVAVAGRFTVGAAHGNPAVFNVAQIHFAGVLLLVLGLPLWMSAAARFPRWLAARWRAQPGRTVAIAFGLLATAGVLGATYANPHPWNRDLFWDGCSFTLLRNWPLVWIDRYQWLRFASGLNLVALAVALGIAWRRQPHAQALALAVAVGLSPIAISSLVEPRYFIPALAFALFFLRLDRRAVLVLTLWWSALIVLHAPFVAAGRSLW